MSVGQGITSDIFDMNCPQIGRSQWALIVFPVGQYDCERDNGQLSVYLKMVGCENESERLVVDVKFHVESDGKEFGKVVESCVFHYENQEKRWVGANLCGKSEFQKEASNKPKGNADLTVRCRILHPDCVNDKANGTEVRTIEQPQGNNCSTLTKPTSISSKLIIQLNNFSKLPTFFLIDFQSQKTQSMEIGIRTARKYAAYFVVDLIFMYSCYALPEHHLKQFNQFKWKLPVFIRDG